MSDFKVNRQAAGPRPAQTAPPTSVKTTQTPAASPDLKQVTAKLSDPKALGLTPLPALDGSQGPKNVPVPQAIRDSIQSKDEKERAEGFSYLSDQSKLGNRKALDYLGTLTEDYKTRDGAVLSYLDGEKFLLEKDYKVLARDGFDSYKNKDSLGKLLTKAVNQERPGAAVAMLAEIKSDSRNSNRHEVLEAYVTGRGDKMSDSDYRLLYDNLEDIGLYRRPNSEELLKKSYCRNRGGVRDLMDGYLSQESKTFEESYSERKVDDILELRSRTDKDYQPPEKLIENLAGLKEKNKYGARDNLEKAFEVASRPKELAAHSHHLIDERLSQVIPKNHAEAIKARLEQGGTEPLDRARDLLRESKPGTDVDGAISVYRLAPERIRLEDINALGDTLKEKDYRWGVVPALGEAGATAKGERLDAIRGHLRTGIDHPDKNTSRQSVEAMSSMAEKLKKDDILALSSKLDYGRVGVLEKALPHQNAESREALLKSMRSELEKDKPNLLSARVLNGLAADLSANDIVKLKGAAERNKDRSGFQSNKPGPVQLVAQSALTQAKDPKTKEAAALALLENPGRAKLDEPTQRELNKVVAASDSKELRDSLTSQLKPAPLNEDNLKALGAEYQKRLEREVRRAQSDVKNGRASRADKSLDELAKLSSAMAMLNDPKSEYHDQIDKAALNKRLKEVSSRPEVRSLMERVRKDAIYETMPHLREKTDRRDYSRKATDPAKAQMDYVMGTDFDARLRLAKTEGDKEKLITQELGLLAQQDPKRAADAQKVLQTRAVLGQATENPLAFIQKLPPEEREAVLGRLMNAAGAGKKGSAMAKQLATAFQRIDTSLLQSGREQSVLESLLKRMKTEGKFSGQAIDKTISGLRSLNESGKLGASLGSLSVASLFLRGVPQSFEGGVRSGSDLLEIASHSGDYAKLLGASDDFLKAGKFAKFAKGAQALGPIGDVITVPFDSYGAYKDFQSGDIVGGSAKLVGAGAGVAGVCFGIAAASPASGPAMPFLAGGAALVGLGAMTVDWIWGNDPTEQALENLGVRKG